MDNPLFVFYHATTCSGCGEEIEFWTDGLRAYALTNGRWETEDFEREGAWVTAHCGRMDIKSDERCVGSVKYNLATDSTHPHWRVASDHDLMLLAGAQEVR